jgi:hypothetical protein
MGRGGSRFGAGRPGHKLKAEYVQRIDVREWARRGYLKSGSSFSWSWTRGDEKTGSIGITVFSAHSLTLRYTFTLNGEARGIADDVPLIRSQCAYGGSRPWFGCPRCAGRVAVLYLRGGRFACRKCQRVAYASQSEDVLSRMWRKQAKLEKRLGKYWQRPKGMRLQTYEKLRQGILNLEGRRDEALAVFAQRLFGLGAFER